MNEGKDMNKEAATAPGDSIAPGSFMKAAAIISVVLVTVLTVVLTQNEQAEKPPTRGPAPAGFEEYKNVVDADFAQALTTQIAQLGDDPVTGNRSSGSPAEDEAAALIEQTMKDIGLQNVTTDAIKADGWVYEGANIQYTDAEGASRTVALGGYQTSIRAVNENIPLVWLERGTAADYEGRNVTGKLVLIDIDQQNDWHIKYPAMQAKLNGARAVIAMSHMEEEIGTRLVSDDIRGPSNAPALAISLTDSQAIQKAIEANGDEKDGGKEISVKFTANSQVTGNAGSGAVWGEIPGKSDETIIFTAHHDGYYHSFYDDACGVGLILSMAKAFVDSGYKPDKTLRFMTLGAGEWGRTDMEADWAIGAYEQIVNNHPEWGEKIFALINIDNGYPMQNMRSFKISAPAELQSFVNQTIVSFGDRGIIRITGNGGLPDTERGDFVFNAYGIPTLACVGGEGDEKYYRLMRHSSLDTLHEGGISVPGVNSIDWFFGYTTMILDELPLRPMNFASRIDALKRSYSSNAFPGGLVDAHLDNNVERALQVARSLDQMISQYNSDYATAMDDRDTEKAKKMKEGAPAINKRLYGTYRLMQDELLRLDWNLSAGFGNQGVQNNITLIDSAVAALKKNDIDGAISSLSGIDFGRMAVWFDEGTCAYFTARMQVGEKDTWSEGRIASEYCNVDPVIRALAEKAAVLEAREAEAGRNAGTTTAQAQGGEQEASEEDVSAELTALGEIRRVQVRNLLSIYALQSFSLSKVMDSMNAVLDITA